MAYRHHYHHHHRHCRGSRRGGAGKRLLTILAIGVAVAVAVSIFRDKEDRSIAPPPAPADLARMSPSNLQKHEADSGIVGGAIAAEAELAIHHGHPAEDLNPSRTVPVNVPVPRPDVAGQPALTSPQSAVDLSPGNATPAIKLRVRSDSPHSSRDKALVDALIKAEIEINSALHEMDPPVEARLDWEKIKERYLRKGSIHYVHASDEVKKAWADANLDTNQVWAEIEVEVTDNQIRELRSEQRVGTGGMAAAIAFVAVLALFGFLRLDAWTRGYLTGGLAIGIAAAAGGAVALMLLAR